MTFLTLRFIALSLSFEVWSGPGLWHRLETLARSVASGLDAFGPGAGLQHLLERAEQRSDVGALDDERRQQPQHLVAGLRGEDALLAQALQHGRGLAAELDA